MDMMLGCYMCVCLGKATTCRKNFNIRLCWSLKKVDLFFLKVVYETIEELGGFYGD